MASASTAGSAIAAVAPADTSAVSIPLNRGPLLYGNIVLPADGQPEDEVYVGPIDDENRPHGIGSILYANRDVGERSRFHGEWVHGKRHGYGVLIRRNGSRYEGNFMDDKLGGQGALCWADGLEYRGEWANNCAHGRGEQRFPNGKRYYGEWLNGKRSGWGHLTFALNDERWRVEYIGGWLDDLQDGEGVMKWSNNAVYQGHWLQGKRDGYGIHIFPTGEKYEGYWKEGVRHGAGRCHYGDGSIYDGGWLNDKKHGNTRIILPHGRVIHELWRYGIKQNIYIQQELPPLHMLCVEALASDNHTISRLHYLPGELAEKIKRLRVYRVLHSRGQSNN